MTVDSVALAWSYFVMTALRYGTTEPLDVGRAAVFACGACLVQILLGHLFQLYRGRVAVASREETLMLGSATLAGGVIVTVVNAVADPYFVSRSVPIGATSLAIVLMFLVRGWWRMRQLSAARSHGPGARRVLVVGAGQAAQQLVTSMLHTADSPLHPVGLLDDDPWKRRRRIDGVPVLGTHADIVDVARRTGAEVLVIAIPSARAELIREVSALGHEAGLDVKVLPGLQDIVAGKVRIQDVRDIDIRDVLGRQPIETDIAAIAGYLHGRRVLVTGAGGSIGSELCRQIDRWEPAELIMLDRDESALHAVQLSLTGRAMLDGPDVVLNDIRDADALASIFRNRRPDVVFHAAALKHLPMLEQYPHEAMKTNVVGTANVLTAAAAVGVERFVNISTDKAADPTSVLGYSKRVAERLTAGVAQTTPGRFLSVRFGNVLGSRGSVITTFAGQIAAGGPVTVTHPDVTRYFMTVSEAVELVIQAAAIGGNGEAMILDMGEPVRIDDVARQLIGQSGRKDIEIVYTGLREGEKLHESLIAEHEVDGRACHRLITDVPVAPLPPAEVRRDANAPDVVARLRRWCDEGRTTHAVAAVEDVPRQPGAAARSLLPVVPSANA